MQRKANINVLPAHRLTLIWQAGSEQAFGEEMAGQLLATAPCRAFSWTLVIVHTPVWVCRLLPSTAEAPGSQLPVSCDPRPKAAF